MGNELYEFADLKVVYRFVSETGSVEYAFGETIA